MKNVYLAGQPNEYEHDWKEEFKKLTDFAFYDFEVDSDQSSPDTFFPDDLKAVASSDILVANPGTAPSEATWVEIGAFYAKHVETPGSFCSNIIIIWKEERDPKWSIEFIRKVGTVVSSLEEAIEVLGKLK